MHGELVGRDLEVARLRAFLDAADPTRCLVLDGEPGIGKTALWEEGLALASQAGYLVLAARAGQAEAALSFAVLADLLDGIDTDVLTALPGPQRHGLEVALRQADPTSPAIDSFAVASGFRALVRELSASAPVLIAVDDAQWMDDASAIPLAYAARRLSDTRVRILLSKRPDTGSAVEGVVPADELQTLKIGPLGVGATGRLLSSRLGPVLPRRVARTVHDSSRGNPLFALEIGRLLADSRARGEDMDVPIPELADDPFAQRIASLPADVRRLLLAVSLSAGLSRTELAEVAGDEAVHQALAADVVTFDRSGARPTHPLLAVSAQHAATPAARRKLHAELADIVHDPGLRAWHLAMATQTPDSATADEVAAAATRAVHSGAAHDGEQLATHAFRLTPLGDPAWPHRLRLLARYRMLAGYREESAAVLQRHLADLTSGRERALAYLLLADLSDCDAQEIYLTAASEQAPSDAEITATVMVMRASALLIARVAQVGQALEWAERAWALTRNADTAVRARAATALAWSSVLAGKSLDDLATTTPEPDESTSMHEYVERPKAIGHAFRGELATAAAVLDRTARRALDRGDFNMTMACEIQRAEFGLRAGRVADVAAILADLPEAEPVVAIYLARLKAVLAAVAGQPEIANGHANDVLEQARSSPDEGWNRIEATRALGIAALYSRDLTAAQQHLQQIWDHTVNEGIDDPGAFPVAADLVEVLVGTDRLHEARDVVERLGALATEQAHPWGLITWRRCTAMIDAATGYTDAAADQLAAAASDYAKLGLRFDQGRTLLFLGSLQRRGRKRGLARASLNQAADEFQSLGCTGWAASARAELARVSGRPPALARHLTASEHAVAELAVDGLSNKEIASRLFVGVSTVEAHLSSTYRKLGVRSRSQLPQALGR